MIYLANERHTDAVRGYLEAGRAQEMTDQFHVITYQELLTRSTFPAQATVFTDHERFTPAQFTLASRLWDLLGEAKVPRFNDPKTVLRRPDLLGAMHEAGINSFQASPANALHEDIRFPVFIREAYEHSGTLTKLIETQSSLHKHLKLLTRFGGFKPQELLVVEFCDVSDDDGLYHKYAAFRFGNHVFPRYIDNGRHWMVKSESLMIREDLIKEELVFMRTNPHQTELRRVYDLAGIDYGRIDYGLKDGRIQVWEINTNPQIGPPPSDRPRTHPRPFRHEWRQETKNLFHDAYREILREVMKGDSAEELPWFVDPQLRDALTREYQAKIRRVRLQEWLKSIRRGSALRRVAASLAGRS